MPTVWRIEAARQHPFELPGYAWRKFRARSHDDPGGRIEEYNFHQKQAFSLVGNPKISLTLGRALAGTPLDTPEQVTAFVDSHYDLRRVDWYNTLEAEWQRAINAWHLPDTFYSPQYNLPGLTALQVAAMLGALAALFRPGAARCFHQAFVPTMAGAGFLVMLTAAVIPRHRFVWEPFWLLYAFLFLDTVCAGIVALWRRFRPGTRMPTPNFVSPEVARP